MTVECYYKNCPNHSFQTEKDDGPYCYHDVCTATEEQVVIFEAEREKEIEEWRKTKQLPTP